MEMENKDESIKSIANKPWYKESKTMLTAVVVTLIIGYGVYLNNPKLLGSFGSKISQEEAKKKTVDFVKNNLVQAGTEVSVKEIAEVDGMYKLTLTVGKQEITSHLSKDGKTFYPEAYDIAETENKTKDQKGKAGATPNPVAAVKQEVPEVDLFVMSYCPFGTQIEKGILPVVDLLKSKIKFKLRFVDYAMHGEKEVDENTRQYCIQKEEPAKLSSYLGCFLKKEDSSAACLKSVGINATKLASCVSAADIQFKIKENTKAGGQNIAYTVDQEDAKKFGVQGSPTLVVNGGQVSAGRDAASLLKAVCSGFNNPPAECQKELSATAPAAGFGEGAGADSAASCH